LKAATRSLLIIEDDQNFAKIMMENGSRAGLQGPCRDPAVTRVWPWHASTRRSAITLDIELPGMDGWSVLDRLKHTKSTRHIPVHIISVTEEKSSAA